MMDSRQIREAFFEFFRKKQHSIVESAPMVIKGDPTLMFTNAGMNQFKDIFLGNSSSESKRIANSQKCLRVSGKHNDLDEVGHDTYHHTMFEMLGNWSFGDYFKKEAIEWGWEFLTDKMGIAPDRIYATVFGGDKTDKLERDNEAALCWEAVIPEPEIRIIDGSRKDNFWEMGETGPCGPCSEIHVDLRSDAERKRVPGHTLVNTDNPQVIEIWNLVFIQYNRKADGELESLPERHVDTGMGFERLCMVLQKKKSNYDTDLFQPLIYELSNICGIKYRSGNNSDIAMRVISDHVRAVSFSIAEGQLPSNNKAGYVIRRILRRAIRYGYTFLGMDVPFIYRLVPVLAETMGDAFPEISKRKEQITEVIREEEETFLDTLGRGIKLIEKKIPVIKSSGSNQFPGTDAFELYDTYGFPFDLTQIILEESGMDVDQAGFDKAMDEQRSRSRSDARKEEGDWVIINESTTTLFSGYNTTTDRGRMLRYRKVKSKNKEFYQVVFDKTPFYAEAGGQVGDTGFYASGDSKFSITDTRRENNLVIHIARNIPKKVSRDDEFELVVDSTRRRLIEFNHSATHLLHHALRKVLGNHVEQKGSLVNDEKLRFDFSYFKKVDKSDLKKIEEQVNKLISQQLSSAIEEGKTMKQALDMGAIALFGEKYGETVRVVRFGDSVELCGGTHTPNTAGIGLFKIISEGAVASGIRRIEAVTSEAALKFVNSRIDTLDEIASRLKAPSNIAEAVKRLQDERDSLSKKVESLEKKISGSIIEQMIESGEEINGILFISGKIEAESPDMLKMLASRARSGKRSFLLAAGASIKGKAHVIIAASDDVVSEHNLDAGSIIREVSALIKGGGGGQPYLATAGGSNPEGIETLIGEIRKKLTGLKE